MNPITRLSFVAGIAAAALFASPLSAQRLCGNEPTVGVTSTAPTVTVCANGTRYDIEGVTQDGKLGFLRPTTIDLGGGASFRIGAAVDADPFASFMMSSQLTAVTTPIIFDVFVSVPIVAGMYSQAMSEFSSTLSVLNPAGAAGTTATISNGYYPTFLSGWGDMTNLGVDVGSVGCSLLTNGVTPCAAGSESNSFAAFSPNVLTAYLSYEHAMTGPGTTLVTWEGRVDLLSTTVPEPTTFALVGVALLTTGVVVRRRTS